MLLRLVRLHPLVVLGSLLGFLAYFVESLRQVAGTDLRTQAALFTASVLLMPYKAAHESSQDLFRLNVPAWSLFWEYMASFLFALVLFRIRRVALVLFTALAALNLCYAGHLAGTLKGGAEVYGLPMGAARVAFSFSMGLLLARLQLRWRTPAGFVWLSILLVLAFLLPFTPGDWMRESAVVLLYFPALVLLGSGATTRHRTGCVCRFLGRLSYPLYMTHYPVVRLWSLLVEQRVLTAVELWLATTVGLVSALALSWVALRFWDEPLRGYLNRLLRERWPMLLHPIAIT